MWWPRPGWRYEPDQEDTGRWVRAAQFRVGRAVCQLGRMEKRRTDQQLSGVWSGLHTKGAHPICFIKKIFFLGRQISRQVWSSYHILHSDLGLVGHERRASQRALYESSIISGVRIDDYSKMRMGLTVGYTSSIRECALLIGVSCPLKKDDVKEMDNYWPRLALAGTSGNSLTRTTILISFL